MANVSKIFKPRRGTKSIMAGTKKSTVLASGEIFVEVPDAGVGKGASKIKIGDGTTAYSSLPYALGDTSNDQITFSSNTSTTVAAALNSVASGGSLKNIVAGLKQAISLCNTSITKLNDDISSAGGIGMTSTQSNQLKAIYDRMVNVPKFTMEEFFYQCNGGQSYIIFDTKEYDTLKIGSRSNTAATLTVLGNGSTTITASNGAYNVSAYNTVTVRLNNATYTSGYLYNIELY